MSAVDDILHQIPMDQLAAELGEDPQTTQAVAADVVQTLFRGMSANAQDPRGEQSLALALDQHASQNLLDGRVDLAQIDTADGQAIVRHVFGPQTDPVIQKLAGASSGNSDLVAKLLPILAPIVLSYIAKRLTQGNSPYGDILGQIISGASGSFGRQTPQAPQQQAPQQGGLSLPDILGQILGGGLGQGGGQLPPQQAPQQQAPQQQVPSQPQGNQPPSIPMGDDDAPAQQNPQGQQGPLGGDILGQILGGLLGGGRRA